MVFWMISTSDLVSTVLPENVWASTMMVLGGRGGFRISLGRTKSQVVCGKGGKLLLRCSKVGFLLEEEGLTFSGGLRKVGHINSRTRVVDTGMSKSCFIVQCLHSIGKEGAKVGPGVLNLRLHIPSVDLQCEL